MGEQTKHRDRWFEVRENRRRAVQVFAAATGGFLLLRATKTDSVSPALAQDDDDDNSGRGRGRGRGRGGDDDDNHDNSGHDGQDGDDHDEQVAGTGQVPPGAVEVRIISEDANGFQPNELTVDLGTTVAFVNTQDDEHTATGSGFDTGEIEPGQVATVVLDTPGVFRYACQFHPEMTGTINVRDASGVVPQAQASASQSLPSDATSVSIANLAFQPAQITVPTGTTVVWTNDDSVPHTVTSADGIFDSGIFDPGGSFTWTFDQPGTFTYQCQLHPQMQGTVTVEGDAVAVASPAASQPTQPEPPVDRPPTGETATVSIVDFAFEPATLEIPAGTTVDWTNEGAAPHTVTGDFADSGTIDPGATFGHTFSEAGTFDYACSFHPDMTGQIVVGAAAPVQTGEAASVQPAVRAVSGIWMVTLTPDSGGALDVHQALVTLHPDGMVQADFIGTGSADAAAATLVSGHGEWRETETGLALALAVLAADAERRFAATGTIGAEIQLDATGTAFDGTFEFALTGSDGRALGEGSGTMIGQIVTIEP